MYLPYKSHTTVSFDVYDNVGLDVVTVRFIRYSGTETREFHFSNAPGSYTTSTHLELRFDFSIFEALATGADVNITAYDVNGNGASGDFHIKSVVEAIVDAIATFLSAIAKVIAEALSIFFAFLSALVSAMICVALSPFEGLFGPLAEQVASDGATMIPSDTFRGVAQDAAQFLGWLNGVISSGWFFVLALVLYLVLSALNVIILYFTLGSGTLLSTIFKEAAEKATVGMLVKRSLVAGASILAFTVGVNLFQQGLAGFMPWLMGFFGLDDPFNREGFTLAFTSLFASLIKGPVLGPLFSIAVPGGSDAKALQLFALSLLINLAGDSAAHHALAQPKATRSLALVAITVLLYAVSAVIAFWGLVNVMMDDVWDLMGAPLCLVEEALGWLGWLYTGANTAGTFGALFA